ncbi:MAG: phage integrase SAM-like domain-containing protein, partial [Muribaculaceae bacterium]|nr:phage integrase SAM-like domain-containing protein [Muribaculaceae bacterium]
MEAFRMKTSAKTNEKTARSFRWASESLERFVSSRSEDITLQPFSASLIRDWCTWLLYQGYTKSTVLNYLKSLRLLHSELVADGLTTDLSIFTILHDILQSLPDTAFGNKQNTDVLKKLRHLIAS